MGSRMYVAVIGSAACDTQEAALAMEVGGAIARRGAVLVCGGRGGVMEAACQGAKAAGGTTIGILPGNDRRQANPYVDVSIATGLGEALMKVVASKTACDMVERGIAPQAAAEAVMQLVLERTGGRGGIIILDRKGHVGVAHTTSHIAYAVVTEGGKIEARMKR